MIPVPIIDDEMYKDILFNAKNLIKQLYPQWTNYNESDPGITIIELFAWLKEMQQFHIDNNEVAFKEKYLKILGMQKVKKQCAKALVEVKSIKKDFFLSERSRFYKENICFETLEPLWIFNNGITEIRNSLDENISFLVNNQNEYQSTIKFLPFCEKLKNKDVFFELDFKFSIPVNKHFGIYFEVFNDYSVKRNKIYAESDFVPLAKMYAECLIDNVWHKIEIISDETFCFLQNGTIILKNTFEFAKSKKIRFVLYEDNYEVYPILTSIKLNVFNVIQKETLCINHDVMYNGKNFTDIPSSYLSEKFDADIFLGIDTKGYKFVRALNLKREYEEESEIVRFTYDLPNENLKIKSVKAVFYDEKMLNIYSGYIGNGFPYQKIKLENENLLGSDFEIIIFDDFEKVFYKWIKVEDFDSSTPESRHYIFNEETGIIIFGDCENGLAPDGEVIIISCVCSLSENGNIKSGDIKLESNDLETEFRITNAYGGSRSETLEQCFMRFKSESHDKLKLVTFNDYEKAVYAVPGLMIKNCNVISTSLLNKSHMNENSVTVIVQPYSKKKKALLNNAYITNIEAFLKKRRLIGTDIRVVSPKYSAIEIYIDIKAQKNSFDIKNSIESKLYNFFESNKLCLGMKLSYSKLYFLIDTLPFIECVNSLNIFCNNPGGKVCENGDIQFLPDTIAYLSSVVCNVSYTK